MDEEMKEMLNTVKDVLLGIADDDEVFRGLAMCYRRMYMALCAEGFSRSEAMDIITSIKVGTK